MSVDRLKIMAKAIGAKQATKAVEKGMASLMYIAEDADTRVTGPIRELCDSKGVAIEMVPSMGDLGKACGIEVGAAAVAILKG